MGDKLFLIAWEALRTNKVRSALTMLGIIIGVMAVIVMIGMGQSSQAYITEQVQGLGASVLIVTPGNPKTAQLGPPGMNTAPTLTLDDAEALESLPGLRFVSANAFTAVTFKFGHQQVAGTVVGSMPAIQEARDLKVAQGRFFTEQETKSGAKVMVVGAKLLRNLAKDPTLDPLTEKVRIEEQRYRIVGVLVEEGGGIFGTTDEQAFIPIRSYQQNLRDGKRINSIFLRVGAESAMAATSVKVAELLRQRHRIRPDEDDDFKLQTQAELLERVQTITQVFTILLAGIAGISLLVGGIGIMNIMLVSVTERTREIGIRMAVGAKRRDILSQFLLESAALSLAGGTIGMLLGIGITVGATRVVGLPYVFSPAAVIGAFVFSGSVGIFFGIYPANKAAKLDPVDALRFE